MVDIDMKNPVATCPFCRDAVAVSDRAVCAACLAVHHLECWTEYGACSSCAGEQVLTMQQRASSPLGERIEELGSDDALVRRWAAYSLRKASPRDKLATEALIATLSDPDRWTRMWSAVALGGIGSAARKAAPRLQELADDPDQHERVRAAAGEALARVRAKAGKGK